MAGIRIRAVLVVTIVLSTWSTIALPAPAQAHVGRQVGRWHFVVGWGDEPAYPGGKNSVQLILSDDRDRPVTDLGDTLAVEVTFSSSPPLKLPLEPNFEVGEFGTAGDYRAWFIPTRAGDYTFRFSGTIKGEKIDQRFTSSKTTFDPVEDSSDIEYPAKDPTNAELATRIEREVPRIDARDVALASSVRSVRSKASTSTTLGVVGVALGGIALLLAVIGIVRRRAA